MIDERELEEYRKHRSEDITASNALRYAKAKLRKEFDKMLRGFSLVQDRRNSSTWCAELDGNRYVCTVDYDDDNVHDYGVRLTDGRPNKGEYPRECITEIDSGRHTKWLIITDETPADLAKYFNKSGDSKQVAYERAVKSVIRRREWHEKQYSGDIIEYVIRVEGHGVDECCGGIEEGYVEEFVWKTIS